MAESSGTSNERNGVANETDAIEAANQSIPFPNATNDEMQQTADGHELKPLETSDHKRDELLEGSEVLFSSEDADEGRPAGEPAPAKAGVTRILDAASEKLEKVKSKTGDSGGDSSALVSPPAEANDSGTPTIAPRRKLFSWLARNTSVDAGLKSPPAVSRRGTTTTEGGDGATPTAAEDAQETEKLARRIHRNSLKDRFKLVRMREEAGVVALDDTDAKKTDSDSRRQSVQDAPELVTADSEEGQQHQKSRQLSTTSRPDSREMQPIINESLPPGSAVGTLTGPSADNEQPVDWDLWQEVVYEGPAAVARTSPDELSLATRRGIPSAIRGVVWQVLAQSKNEDLEAMYTELVARGMDRERGAGELKPRPSSSSRPSSMSRPTTGVMSPTSTKGKDGVNGEKRSMDDHAGNRETQLNTMSSHSSVKSEPPTPTGSRPPLGTSKTSQDKMSISDSKKADADALTEEQQRIKEEDAALQKLERAIKRDLGSRTSFSKFLMSAGLQDGLFGICKAYALFDEEVGYAQGMNFIAMPLLFNMPEEEAFCLFVRLMNQYRLRDLFVPEMPGLHLHLYQFERLLEDLEPAVYCHLNRRNVHPQLYATQWFLTLFAYRFPLQLVLRIYDLILSEGLESAILKFGIVLMQKNTEKLLEMKDMAALTTFLKERLFDVYIDQSPSASSLLESGFFGSAGGIDREVYRADALVEDACAANVTQEMLKQYTLEWEEKVRDEKEKQAAMDSLHNKNASLTQRVRELESRTQQLDGEHVTIASDLVRTKVANQTLTDENEALRTRVAELQEIIDAQPAQVEEQLRSEMERIMTRNAEVQAENRALEESVAEMEGELATAKLNYAEKAEEAEAIRRKWSNVTNMMSGVGGPASAG